MLKTVIVAHECVQHSATICRSLSRPVSSSVFGRFWWCSAIVVRALFPRPCLSCIPSAVLDALVSHTPSVTCTRTASTTPLSELTPYRQPRPQTKWLFRNWLARYCFTCPDDGCSTVAETCRQLMRIDSDSITRNCDCYRGWIERTNVRHPTENFITNFILVTT